jgi:regulator of replication initiation timing
VLTESDKVTVTKYPPLPSKCRVCLRDSNGQVEFVDFQLSFDYEGAVNICIDCMRNIAQVLGFIDQSEGDSLKAQVQSLVEINRELAENNDRLNTSLDLLLSLRPSLADRRVDANATAEHDSGTDAEQLTIPFEGDTDSTESSKAR